MSDKKRFGKISSIFNHSHSSPPPSTTSSTKSNPNSTSNRATISKSIPLSPQTTSPSKPLNKPLLNNNHNYQTPHLNPNYLTSNNQLNHKSSQNSLNPSIHSSTTISSNNHNHNFKNNHLDPSHINLSPQSTTTNTSNVRRKPPPLLASNTSDSDSFIFNPQHQSPSSPSKSTTSSSSNRPDIIADLGIQIDNFLINDQSSSRPSTNYDDDLDNDAPYPLDSLLSTPTESPRIIQNDQFFNDNTLEENPFESTYSSITSPSSQPTSNTQQYTDSTNMSLDYLDRKLSQSSFKQSPPILNQTSQQSSLNRVPTQLSKTSPNQTPFPPTLNKTPTNFTYSSSNSYYNHRPSSSIGSITSNSSRNVNLAILKKTMNLKPGEGERSYYVYSIRKAAGTAYNENGPLKWKLPVGILPVDKSAAKENSNGKYKRLIGVNSYSHRSRYQKTSGVELKHGHLKPRLLASEVDDREDSNVFAFDQKKTMISPLKNNESNEFDNSKVSRDNSLRRTITDGSLLTGDTQSSISTNTTSSKLNRSNSNKSVESSGSLNDNKFNSLGYYQHKSYKYDEEESDATELNNDEKTQIDDQYVSGFMNDDMNIDEERPKLVLANPDYDSSGSE